MENDFTNFSAHKIQGRRNRGHRGMPPLLDASYIPDKIIPNELCLVFDDHIIFWHDKCSDNSWQDYDLTKKHHVML